MQSVAFWGVNGLRQHLAQTLQRDAGAQTDILGSYLHRVRCTCYTARNHTLLNTSRVLILKVFLKKPYVLWIWNVELSSVQILVQSNGLSDRIEILEGKVEEISCPEVVDVLVSEPMGNMLLSDGLVESFLHAKQWLKPNGRNRAQCQPSETADPVV